MLGKHIELSLEIILPIGNWDRLLTQIKNSKLIRKSDGRDHTNQFQFINGWMVTIQSVKKLWLRLKQMGISYLNLRNLNQDPLENLFCLIREHGMSNNNPNCHQFVAALKTTVLNRMFLSGVRGANCEDDRCESLDNFAVF